jgi:hypothetical protein
MNTLREALTQKVETVDFRGNNVGGDRKANVRLQPRSVVVPFRLEARVGTVESRCEDLEKRHWKKVWRSMVED